MEEIRSKVRLAYKNGDIDYYVACFSTIEQAEEFLIQNKHIREEPAYGLSIMFVLVVDSKMYASGKTVTVENVEEFYSRYILQGK